MKKGFYLVAGLAIMVSCSKSSSSEKEIEDVKTSAEAGGWTVQKMIDSGQDETSDFQGYTLTFNSDGTLSATNGAQTHTGTWSVTNSNSSDDDSSDDSDVDFNINFNVSDSHDFDDLNDDWDIISHSDTKIELEDVSGGNGDTDLLTLVR